MTNCIIRSSIAFDDAILESTGMKKLWGKYYYHLTCSGKEIKSQVKEMSVFNKMISDACKNSKYIELWKEKESMYDFESFADICYSQEYFALKSKITEEVFRGILVTDDVNLFEVRAEVIGSYKDYQLSGELPVMIVSKYVDLLCNTGYSGVRFDSVEGYLTTRSDFVL